MNRPRVRPPSCDGAHVVTLTAAQAASVPAARDALPDPSSLAAGQLVVVRAEIGGEKSLASSVLSVLGRKKTVSRALRCSALVARGYVDVGAGTDPAGKDDLAWGYASQTRLERSRAVDGERA